MFSVILALFFGLICMVMGFYGGYMLSENKNLKDTLEQYETEDFRYNLEQQFESE